MLPREHLVGCQGVKMFLLKDPFKVFFNQPGPKAGSIHSIEVSVCCLFVCLSRPIYFFMVNVNIPGTPNIFTDSGPLIK